MTDNNDSFKNKREQFTIQIRKKNREEIFNKRRNLVQTSANNQQFEEMNQNKTIIIIDQRYYEQIQMLINSEYDDSMFDQLAQNINDPDILVQHRGVIGMRKLLARNVDPPIKRFIDKGLTNKCIWLAKQKQFPHIKMQATWILTNVASGESAFCQRLVQRGGIDLFVTLLRENQKGIVDQAIWGIGNLAADKVKFRDQILKKGGLTDLTKIIQNSKDKIIIRNGAWAVTNLCRGHPHPDTKYIKQALPLLCKVIKTGALKVSNNKEVLSDVIWAISHMTQNSKPRIERVCQAEILQEIFKYAQDSYSQIYVPALKIIGNFTSGNSNHTDQLIKHGIFDLALRILQHPKKPIRKQMCWALSNIAAGVQSQVEIFISHTDLMNKIGTLFHQDVIQVKRQICWIYANMGLLGNRIKIIQLYLHYDIIRIFTNLLNQEDSQTLEHVLQTLYKILFIGKKCLVEQKNILLQKFLQYGGGERLTDLQMHENPKVYQLVVKILTKYFDLQANEI